MRKIECDKCGKELAPLRPEWSAVEVNLPTGSVHVDLCERCVKRLRTWCQERDPVAA